MDIVVDISVTDITLFGLDACPCLCRIVVLVSSAQWQVTMLGSDQMKGDLVYSAEITYVQSGIEYHQTIEDVYPAFYARVCGAIEGITRGGAQITLLSTMSDPYAIVNA